MSGNTKGLGRDNRYGSRANIVEDHNTKYAVTCFAGIGQVEETEDARVSNRLEQFSRSAVMDSHSINSPTNQDGKAEEQNCQGVSNIDPTIRHTTLSLDSRKFTGISNANATATEPELANPTNDQGDPIHGQSDKWCPDQATSDPTLSCGARSPGMIDFLNFGKRLGKRNRSSVESTVGHRKQARTRAVGDYSFNEADTPCDAASNHRSSSSRSCISFLDILAVGSGDLPADGPPSFVQSSSFSRRRTWNHPESPPGNALGCSVLNSPSIHSLSSSNPTLANSGSYSPASESIEAVAGNPAAQERTYGALSTPLSDLAPSYLSPTNPTTWAGAPSNYSDATVGIEVYSQTCSPPYLETRIAPTSLPRQYALASYCLPSLKLVLRRVRQFGKKVLSRFRRDGRSS
jgi:hypothetical protein